MAARRSMILRTLLVASALVGCATTHDPARPQPRGEALGTPRLEGARRIGAGIETVSSTPRPEASSIYLVLKLGERRLYLVDGDDRLKTPAVVDSFPVAIGRQEYATPVGRFQVNDMIEDPEWVQFDWEDPSRVIRTFPPGPDNPMGRRWIGFASAHGWQVGFHGTPHPELLGRAVSHGCVRMRNEDVVKVYDRVSLGTVVIVEP
jgi:lipoprotein-anchoring transpeptidase ErfK/SrfK